MIRLIKRSEIKKTPWKNGQGLTSEIILHPPTSNFPKDEFLWRISIAEIKAPNSFSEFVGYDRILVVWKGLGLTLNGIKLEPFVPFTFPGEKSIQYDLLGSEVLDLGVIFRRDLVKCQMNIYEAEKDAKIRLQLDPKQITFIFCTEGLLNIQGMFLQEGDTLQIAGPVVTEIMSAAKSRYIIVKIKEA